MAEWTSELPALAALSDEDAAAAINAMTVQQSVMVYGSFRTLAALLTSTEYNALRATLNSAAAAEAAAGGSLINDAVMLLKVPGDQAGNGGGLALNDPTFVAQLDAISAMAGLNEVPGKVASYVAGMQPAPKPKHEWVRPGDVSRVRAGGQP